MNSLRYSGTEVVASIFVWKASASLCEMVDEARISIEGGGIRPVVSVRGRRVLIRIKTNREE